ncbi:MAG: DoxX family protein [Phycisphaerales bacterium]|jgi:uncharacterized membrane protein YphA (DoxX/SURF4 family)|nr:DoxX family protein [Phycisphaerales bacterium]
MTNFATTSLMPFLARLVIAAAMLTSGWVNCFSQVQIRPKLVEGLRSMDIEIMEVVDENTEEVVTTEDVVTNENEEAEPKESKTKVEKFTTRGVNRIVWLVHEKWEGLGGWGTLIAWSAAVVQLVAGVLLIVGLFTRLAALAICIATGMAIYFVSVNIHGMFSMNPFEWPLDSHRFIQLFAGSGLFILSLGLVFSGGGSFSLDRRHSKHSLEQKTKSTKNSSD